jgi:DNA-binding NtrC family response regulator
MERTVLFVDDDLNILSALQRILSRGSYKVIVTSHASEALEIVDRESPQVVVSDLRMPDASGVELLRTVRERHPDAITILMTGCAGPEEVEAERRGEIFRLLSKPWVDEDLNAALRDAFECFARNLAGGPEWMGARAR